MSNIKNLGDITTAELNMELSAGAKFVIFEYTVSILVMTFKRPTDIYFLRAGESHWGHSWPFTVLSFVLGWWGIPWGFIYTPMAIYTNLSGGKDVTNEVVAAMKGGGQG